MYVCVRVPSAIRVLFSSSVNTTAVPDAAFFGCTEINELIEDMFELRLLLILQPFAALTKCIESDIDLSSNIEPQVRDFFDFTRFTVGSAPASKQTPNAESSCETMTELFVSQSESEFDAGGVGGSWAEVNRTLETAATAAAAAAAALCLKLAKCAVEEFLFCRPETEDKSPLNATCLSEELFFILRRLVLRLTPPFPFKATN